MTSRYKLPLKLRRLKLREKFPVRPLDQAYNGQSTVLDNQFDISAFTLVLLSAEVKHTSTYLYMGMVKF